MVIILLIIFIILFSYLFIKVNKKIDTLKEIITYSVKSQVTENKLYLLDEIGNKSTSNLDFLYKEIEKLKKEKQDEFRTYVENLINNKIIEIKDLQTLEFQTYSKETKVYIDKLQQQLIFKNIVLDAALQDISEPVNKQIYNTPQKFFNLQ